MMTGANRIEAWRRGAVLLLCAVLSAPLSAAEQPITREEAASLRQELKELRAMVEQLRAQSRTETAPAPVVRLPLAERPALGRADAPVVMVEFTDYQCPYCRRFHETVFPELKKRYIDTGRVRFMSLDLPLAFHSDARGAAHAVRCAAEQGKFWGLRDRLMAAEKLSPETLESRAADEGLDMNAFHDCMALGRYAAAIDADRAVARDAGITGTPTVVVGTWREGVLAGRKVVGARPASAFAPIIDAALADAAAGQAQEAPVRSKSAGYSLRGAAFGGD